MEIKTADFVISNTDYRRCPTTGLPEFAFIGRSNVGKSSLINMLTRRKALAMTSSTPGKTLLINHFIINGKWYLVDLPGYGYARRGKQAMEELRRIISSYILGRDSLTCLFVLIDSRLAPQKNDLSFITWLGENGVPFAIIFTKADKMGGMRLQQNVDAFLDALREDWEELPPYFVSSASRGTGREEILDYVQQILASLAPDNKAEKGQETL